MVRVWLLVCVSMCVRNQMSDWQVIFQTANAPAFTERLMPDKLSAGRD
ncbi:hypothetical protein O2268_005240 [Salmonella enterica]|nr:hypothetical protein [Salmonella enterica subsp. diarizonae]EKG3508556.1 hypothetical protein [Salmonella enterica]